MNDETAKQSLFVVLRNRAFALFWLGNLVSGFGVWMQNLAQGWLILKLSDSTLYLGLCGFATLIPTLALSLIGGTLADRTNRRGMLLVTQSALMLIALVLAFITAAGVVTPLLIVMLAFLSGIATALNSPAYQAVIPDLVPPEDLTRAIALNSIQFNLARIGGHSVAGVAVATIGEAGCFLLNGLTYLVMIAVLLTISIPSKHIQRDVARFSSRLTEGIVSVSHEPTLRKLILLAAAVSLLGLPYFFLLPVFARDILHTDARGLGFLTASVSVGALLGGLLMVQLTAQFGKTRVLKVAVLLFWGCLIGFSFSHVYSLSCFLLIGLGLMLVLTLSTSVNLLQELTPPERRGRTMSVQSMAVNGLAPVGTLFAGAMAEELTVSTTVLLLSLIGLVLAAAVVYRLNKSD